MFQADGTTCVQFHNSGKWADSSCGTEFRFICEGGTTGKKLTSSQVFVIHIWFGYLLYLSILYSWLFINIADSCYERGINYPGKDLNDGTQTKTDSAEKCQRLCKEEEACVAFTWSRTEDDCWLKHTKPSAIPSQNHVSGNKNCGNGHIDYPLIFHAKF